jgi:hypothetical protein
MVLKFIFERREIMDKPRNNRYDDNPKTNQGEVVKMVTISKNRTVLQKPQVAKPVEPTKRRKKKSALEISDSIGVYGAFGRTLLDLHKQGR